MIPDAQTFANILVLGMADIDVIATIDNHRGIASTEGLIEHAIMADMLTIALDNMYGEDSFANYKALGILPHEQ